MEEKEKEYTRLKLAACLRKILKENKQTDIKNRDKGIEDISLVDSMRQLEAASGLSFTIIQTISVGKRDPQFTTLITLIESLDMSLSKFVSIYEKITNEEIQEVKKDIEAKKKRTTISPKKKRK